MNHRHVDLVNPAFQATVAAPTPAIESALADNGPEISVLPNGRITGIDGMLDQIAEALANRVVPAVAREVLPFIQQDKELQDRVAAAAGRAAASEIKPWVALLAVSATIYVVYKIVR